VTHIRRIKSKSVLKSQCYSHQCCAKKERGLCGVTQNCETKNQQRNWSNRGREIRNGGCELDTHRVQHRGMSDIL